MSIYAVRDGALDDDRLGRKILRTQLLEILRRYGFDAPGGYAPRRWRLTAGVCRNGLIGAADLRARVYDDRTEPKMRVPQPDVDLLSSGAPLMERYQEAKALVLRLTRYRRYVDKRWEAVEAALAAMTPDVQAHMSIGPLSNLLGDEMAADRARVSVDGARPRSAAACRNATPADNALANGSDANGRTSHRGVSAAAADRAAAGVALSGCWQHAAAFCGGGLLRD